MKYDTRFGDAFWNSSEQSYFQYMMQMMTSWALICDVWYLPPMMREVRDKMSTNYMIFQEFIFIINDFWTQINSTSMFYFYVNFWILKFSKIQYFHNFMQKIAKIFNLFIILNFFYIGFVGTRIGHRFRKSREEENRWTGRPGGPGMGRTAEEIKSAGQTGGPTTGKVRGRNKQNWNLIFNYFFDKNQ